MRGIILDFLIFSWNLLGQNLSITMINKDQVDKFDGFILVKNRHGV